MNIKSDLIEENRLKQLIICKLCHETLEDPIILPCFKTICSKHLLDEVNNFKCNLCDNLHDKTVDKFPANEELNELVQISDDFVDLNLVELGADYNTAKEQCKQLNDLIKESELLSKDPAFYINDYFTKLRNEIDLSKEQLIEDIEQKHDRIITELKKIELKCISQTRSKEFKRLDDIIIEEKNKLMETSLLIKASYNRGSCCAEISIKSCQSINELKFQMNKFQADLLDYKQYKFKSISTKDSLFGDLLTYDTQKVSLVHTLTGHSNCVTALTILQNGSLVSGSDDETVKIWNPTTGALIQTLTGHTDEVWALTVLQNGNLVSGSVDHSIKIWNPTTGELIQTLTGHSNFVRALTVLNNDNLVSGSSDHSIKIWNPTTGTLIQTLTGHAGRVTALTVLQNGNLVSGSVDHSIKIWNPTTGTLIQTLTGHTSFVRALTVLQNGDLASGSADNTIKIWNPTTGTLIKTLTGHTDEVWALTVLQNGNLVSGSDDTTIKICN